MGRNDGIGQQFQTVLLRRVLWGALMVLSLGVAGCGDSLTPAPVRDFHSTTSRPKVQAKVKKTNHYTVRAGDTLYSIAWRYGVDHRRLADWNGVPYPYTIYPGQRLVVTKPKAVKTIPARPVKKRVSSPSAKTKTSTPQAAPKKPVPRASSVKYARSGIKLRWQWPTKGKVVQGFSAKDPGRKGIKIAGAVGGSVYAAEAGTVVYSGTGLIGYGQLIIIKHSNDYLSAYGHNRRLLVKEGGKVKRGMRIAEMGKNGNGRAQLHFEIRYNGTPVDPMSLLPSRR